MSPEVCPNCGAEVPAKANACPECGSDESTGWSENAASSGLDLPGEGFNYKDFVEDEFGSKSRAKPRGLNPFWWSVGILTTLAFLWSGWRWLFR